MSTRTTRTATPRWTEQRRALRDRRSALIASTIRAAAADSGEPLGTIGETEHLVAYEQRNVDAALDAMARRELAEIDHALAHLDAGTYGTCEACGATIAEERLEAIPTATTCVGCAIATG